MFLIELWTTWTNKHLRPHIEKNAWREKEEYFGKTGWKFPYQQQKPFCHRISIYCGYQLWTLWAEALASVWGLNVPSKVISTSVIQWCHSFPFFLIFGGKFDISSVIDSFYAGKKIVEGSNKRLSFNIMCLIHQYWIFKDSICLCYFLYTNKDV